MSDSPRNIVFHRLSLFGCESEIFLGRSGSGLAGFNFSASFRGVGIRPQEQVTNLMGHQVSQNLSD
jgi:hypothetical protein